MSSNPFESMLRGGAERRSRREVHPDIEAERLRDACALYRREHEFADGDLVVYKCGVSVTSTRRGSEPVFIVLEVFPDAPVCLDVEDLGHYGLRYDVMLGHYDEDDDFVTGATDSRRLEPWPRSGDAA